MARTRKINKHLPPRVYFVKGAYRFRPVSPAKGDKTWVTLGRSLSEMWRAYAEMQISNEYVQRVNAVNQLIDRYLNEISIQKSETSAKNDLRNAKRVKKIFGNMILEDITPVEVYTYLDQRGKKGK